MAFVVVGRIRFGRCGALLCSKTALCNDSHGAVFVCVAFVVISNHALLLWWWQYNEVNESDQPKGHRP